MNKTGILIVLSGPSGCGKDTVLSQLIDSNEDIKVSISMTTRAPRAGEIDGVDYYFVTREYFEKKIADGSMLEYAEYNGNYYGTPKAPVDEMLRNGISVVLEIEVQGAEKIRKLYPDAVSVFLLPPSLNALEYRLRTRGTEDEETLAHRLYIGEQEIKRAGEFDYYVINDKIRDALDDFETIIRAEKLRMSRNKNVISEVINNV
ncbi:MAG: guanylate kinase [Clostridia bacterium]|nr:guanylate kinase [Clostridia bacterium]MBR6334990.1 guanylate kinase [Clostridia bacterium]